MQQVKSKQRVADHGEVFTNEREVNAMLDLVWENFITVDKKISATYLEPACGSGNFLVAILERKLALVKKHYGQTRVSFEQKLIEAVSSLYGVELLEDNAHECRERLYALILKYYPKKYQEIHTFPQMEGGLRYILSQNIICGNALDYTTSDGNPIIFTHWAMGEAGMVSRNFFDFREISNVKDGMQSLFGELQQDNPPPDTHYLELAPKS